ncbi:MAG: hypothetical protein ACTHJQ_12050 [Rhizobiaceae bacterium]
MAKVRSPSYPSISLKEAVEKVASIYEQNYQSPVPRAVAAELMGYGGLNGKSLGVLSALSKYGLLEGRGDDTRVSDLALNIIAHESGAPERGIAIRTAASRPELFAEIDGRFAGGKASDAAIRSWLITQKFIPTAADAVVRSYRETKQLVSTESLEVEFPPVQKEPEKPTMQAAATQQDPRSFPFKDLVSIPADDPYEISISGNSRTGKRIEGRFSFADQKSVDELVGILQAMKPQLPKAVIPPMPADTGRDLEGEEAERQWREGNA